MNKTPYMNGEFKFSLYAIDINGFLTPPSLHGTKSNVMVSPLSFTLENDNIPILPSRTDIPICVLEL